MPKTTTTSTDNGFINGFSSEEFIFAHNKIVESGRYNFQKCKFTLKTRLNVDFFRFMLTDYPDKQLCNFLEFGFPIGYFGKARHSIQGKIHLVHWRRNHSGAKDFPKEIEHYLLQEIKYRAVLGPFLQNPFNSNIVLSPLNSVPKRDSVERRVILDLSYPEGEAINDFVAKDFYLGDPVKLLFPNVDNLVDLIKIKGRGCMLFKRDLKRAYRQIPIDPGDISLVGYSWNRSLYFDTVLSMGLRSAAHICQRVTNSVTYICSILHILIINYLDDLAGAETPDRAQKSFMEMGKVLQCCGLEESTAKACSPSTVMSFVGVLFNTETLTLQVTAERLVEIRLLIDSWLRSDNASVKDFQSLIGKLNFVAACVEPGRIFICRLLNWLRHLLTCNISHRECVEIPNDIKKDLLWWKYFMRYYNGVSMMNFEVWSEPDSVISCDSCLLGCGGWFQGRYFHAKFPTFITNLHLPINSLELLTIVVTLKLWGSYLSGQKICLRCDNMSSVRVVNSGFSRDPFHQSCLREICYIAATHNFCVKTSHIKGTDNHIPDLLSRWFINSDSIRARFYDLCQGYTVEEFHVPENLFSFSHDW